MTFGNESPEITSEMTDQDWQDVAESQFRDYTQSPIKGKSAFVFDHEEIGLHGFQFDPHTGTLEPCSFEEVSDDE